MVDGFLERLVISAILFEVLHKYLISNALNRSSFERAGRFQDVLSVIIQSVDAYLLYRLIVHTVYWLEPQQVACITTYIQTKP